MPETTPLIKAALNLRGGAGFDVYGVRRVTGVLRSVVYHVYRVIAGEFRLTAILHHYSFRSLCAQLLILPRNYSSCNIISFILKIFTFFPAFEYL